MKKLINRLLSIILVTILLTSNVIASTNVDDTKKLTPNYVRNEEAETQLREMLKKEGASQITIDRLIQKLKNGELWDSFKSEYKDLKPQIDTPTYKKTIYPDGSIVVAGVIENSIKPLRKDDLHYEYDVEIYKNTMVINAYFTINYIRDTVSNTARINYQSTPIVNIWDISGHGQAYDMQYDYDKEWKNPTCAWLSFYPLGAIMGEKCWLRGYANGYGHWIDYDF